MAENTKRIVSVMVKYLKEQFTEGNLPPDACESLEVAIQCLESAYEVDSESTMSVQDKSFLEYLYNFFKEKEESQEKQKAEAEKLKNDGNELMKMEKYTEALDKYTRAIVIDNNNAVFYCNRAAAYSKLNNHELAISDCKSALRIDPSYSKAHGRLGLAYSSLNKHAEALVSYKKAVELEPDNESYRNNLALTEEKLKRVDGTPEAGVSPGVTPFDLGMLLNNTALMDMATQMLSDPAMQNMMSGLVQGNAQGGAPGMEALIEAGQQLAQQMQNTNPDLVDNLRRHMDPNGDQTDHPDKPNQ